LPPQRSSTSPQVRRATGRGIQLALEVLDEQI
jgi:hypothetical protein